MNLIMKYNDSAPVSIKVYRNRDTFAGQKQCVVAASCFCTATLHCNQCIYVCSHHTGSGLVRLLRRSETGFCWPLEIAPAAVWLL